MIWAGRVGVCSPSMLGVAWGMLRWGGGWEHLRGIEWARELEVRLNLILQSARARTLVLINKDFCCKSQWEKRRSSELIAETWSTDVVNCEKKDDCLFRMDGSGTSRIELLACVYVVWRFSAGLQNGNTINHPPTALSRTSPVNIYFREHFWIVQLSKIFSAFALRVQPFKDQGLSYRKHS